MLLVKIPRIIVGAVFLFGVPACAANNTKGVDMIDERVKKGMSRSSVIEVLGSPVPTFEEDTNLIPCDSFEYTEGGVRKYVHVGYSRGVVTWVTDNNDDVCVIY